MPAGQPRLVELPRGFRGGRRLALAAAAFLLPVQFQQGSPPWFSSNSVSSGSISQATTKTAWVSVAGGGVELKRQRYILTAAAVSATEGERDAQSFVDLLDANGPIGDNGKSPAPQVAEKSATAAAAEATVEPSSAGGLPVEAGAANNRGGDNTDPRTRWPRVGPGDVTRALGQRFRDRRLHQGRTATVGDFNLGTRLPRNPNSQQQSSARSGPLSALRERWRGKPQWWRKRLSSTLPTDAVASVTEEVPIVRETEDGRISATRKGKDGIEDTRPSGSAADEGFEGLEGPIAVAGVTMNGGCSSSVGRSGDRGQDTDGACGWRSRPAIYDGEEVSQETWTKVDELRRRAENCDPKTPEGRGLQLWLEGGGEGRDGLTDIDLLRFVQFRHGLVDAAWQQLQHAGKWRMEWKVEDVLFEEQWTRFKELQAEIFWIGRDTGGRPTMVLRSISHHPGRIDTDDFQRYFLYLLEQGRQLWGVGSTQQMNIVVDRVGAGLKNQDPRLLAAMLPVFRDAYPDIIYRCYVAPTSWIFRFVWIIAARLVDARQRKRVLLLFDQWQSSLLTDFDASILPHHLGGTMEQYPPELPPRM